jgi:hypothetical protein
MEDYEDDTYEEFIDRVYASYEHPANTKELGEVFFKKLKKERPDIAARIKGTLFDPKEHYGIHDKIYDYIRTLWYEEKEES